MNELAAGIGIGLIIGIILFIWFLKKITDKSNLLKEFEVVGNIHQHKHLLEREVK